MTWDRAKGMMALVQEKIKPYHIIIDTTRTNITNALIYARDVRYDRVDYIQINAKPFLLNDESIADVEVDI
jgi:hypothetical protein